jgi:hypothetical protein
MVAKDPGTCHGSSEQKENNMTSRATTLVAAALLLLLPVASSAQLGTYTQNFESLGLSDPAALSGNGWVVYGNVFDPTHSTYYYGYGSFPAPNPGGGFSALVSGQGGAAQGAQQLSIYNDYNNSDHANGNLIEANVYREMTVAAGDVGKVAAFKFEAKHGNWTGGSATCAAFIKTLNPAAGWATTNYITSDMTNAPQAWGTYTITLPISAALVGQILQFGFTSTATHYDPSVIFYDNIYFTPDATTPVRGHTWGQLRANYR